MKSRISDLSLVGVSLVGEVEFLIPFFELRAREEREVKRCQLLVPEDSAALARTNLDPRRRRIAHARLSTRAAAK